MCVGVWMWTCGRCCFPTCHEQEKDRPFPGRALSYHHVTSSKNTQGLHKICAACPMLISSSFQRYPVCPRRLHVSTEQNLHARLSQLQAGVIVTGQATLILDHSRYQPHLGYFPALSTSQVLAFTPLMFQCWNIFIILRTWYRTHAAASAASRGLGAVCFSCGPDGLFPEDPAMTWNSRLVS